MKLQRDESHGEGRSAVTDWTIPVGSETTSAVYEPADGDQVGVFVCAHGAGGNMRDRGVTGVSQALRAVGIGVVRFNFLYTERKTRRIDPMPRLKETAAAVVDHVRGQVGARPLVMGGRSMGGRVASMVVADGYECDGLLLLAYPLHPAGKPEQLRTAHLSSIRAPVLCVNGTRDALCRRDLMETALASVRSPWTMHWLDGADHSFHVLTSSGLTDAEVLAAVARVARTWIEGLP